MNKDITMQAFVGFLMAAVVFGLLFLLFDARKHGVNYDLVLDKREWSCTETKNERYSTIMMAGKVPITQRHNREVCITMKRN